MLILLIITVSAWNVLLGLLLTGIEYRSSTENMLFAVYGMTDCIMSISLMILFFRPICTKSTLSVDGYTSIVRKYAVLSALQLVVVANVVQWTGAPRSTVKLYSDIRNVLSMVDCLALIISMYLGFARQETVCTYSVIEPYNCWTNDECCSLKPPLSG